MTTQQSINAVLPIFKKSVEKFLKIFGRYVGLHLHNHIFDKSAHGNLTELPLNCCQARNDGIARCCDRNRPDEKRQIKPYLNRKYSNRFFQNIEHISVFCTMKMSITRFHNNRALLHTLCMNNLL